MAEPKLRLYAGTINARPDEEGWRNFTLDIAMRPVWDRDLNMGVWPSFTGDIANLVDFRDAMFEEVVLHHVLEHLHRDHGDAALREIHRVLKPGGTLDIETPDAWEVARQWVAGDIDADDYQQWTYGEQLPYHAESDSHRYGWTATSLAFALVQAGFDEVDDRSGGLACRFVATKREEA